MNRLAAAALAAMLLAAPGCELNPQAVANAAVNEGVAALEARQPETAEKAFLRALARDPQITEANLGLAKVYDYYLVDNNKAYQYYKRFIDVLAITDQVETERERLKYARARVKIMGEMQSGVIEDPETAVADIVNAILSPAAGDARAAIVRRLDLTFIKQLAAQRKTAADFASDARAAFDGARPRLAYRDLAPAAPGAKLRVATVCLKLKSGHVAARLVAATPETRSPKPGPEGFWLIEQWQVVQ